MARHGRKGMKKELWVIHYNGQPWFGGVTPDSQQNYRIFKSRSAAQAFLTLVAQNRSVNPKGLYEAMRYEPVYAADLSMDFTERTPEEQAKVEESLRLQFERYTARPLSENEAAWAKDVVDKL